MSASASETWEDAKRLCRENGTGHVDEHLTWLDKFVRQGKDMLTMIGTAAFSQRWHGVDEQGQTSQLPTLRVDFPDLETAEQYRQLVEEATQKFRIQ